MEMNHLQSDNRTLFCACAGADVNSEAKDGATPLYEACRNDHTDIAEYLLSQSADANRPGKDGLLPLHIAAKHGNDRYQANNNHTNMPRRQQRSRTCP